MLAAGVEVADRGLPGIFDVLELATLDRALARAARGEGVATVD